jgi:hypothetical protein
MALGENRSLAISVLTRKTVMLLALASLLRVSELASINLSSIIFSNSGVTFTLLKPSTMGTMGHYNQSLFRVFRIRRVVQSKQSGYTSTGRQPIATIQILIRFSFHLFHRMGTLRRTP